jgi:ATP-dependent phosphofructokinase / diphosphate-dependent phosphofructokinase
MLRLRRDDFTDPREIARYAAVTRLSPDEFRQQFEYLVSSEAPPLAFGS